MGVKSDNEEALLDSTSQAFKKSTTSIAGGRGCSLVLPQLIERRLADLYTGGRRSHVDCYQNAYQVEGPRASLVDYLFDDRGILTFKPCSLPQNQLIVQHQRSRNDDRIQDYFLYVASRYDHHVPCVTTMGSSSAGSRTTERHANFIFACFLCVCRTKRRGKNAWETATATPEAVRNDILPTTLRSPYGLSDTNVYDPGCQTRRTARSVEQGTVLIRTAYTRIHQSSKIRSIDHCCVYRVVRWNRS